MMCDLSSPLDFKLWGQEPHLFEASLHPQKQAQHQEQSGCVLGIWWMNGGGSQSHGRSRLCGVEVAEGHRWAQQRKTQRRSSYPWLTAAQTYPSNRENWPGGLLSVSPCLPHVQMARPAVSWVLAEKLHFLFSLSYSPHVPCPWL